ncbi:MAG: sulfatase-like hydrolase/transferase [bacterium]|nr:hypothetical protein [Planctomycetota bacterium]HIL53166.1 hypothetical protein [Planctomycetota bacterium]
MRLLILSGCLAFIAACIPVPAAVPGPRSVLLVTIDTTRADHIGCYGYEWAKTPVIDSLSAEGVRFAWTFSVAPVTFPAHVSLLTGTIPPYHGVRDNGTHRAVPELLSLAEVLAAKGFQTAAFTAAFVLDAQFGLDQGFDVYEGTRHKTISAAGMVEERSALEVNRSARRWLDGLAAEQPFFLWVHYFEPHQPYPAADALPMRFRQRPYDGEIHAADTALGQLLAHLGNIGRREETLVVVTSDHGESLGEHGEASHSYFAYQGTLHVPLIMAHGSLPRGYTVEQKTSLIDVFPTVLELLHLPAPVGPPPGRSLAVLFDGRGAPDVPTYFESLSPFLNYGWAPIQGVALGDHKLIAVPRAELYDWRHDAAESDNLFASEPALAARLHHELEQLLSANQAPKREHSSERSLTSADRAALARLGYIGTASARAAEATLEDPKDGIARVHQEERIRELILAGNLDEGARQLKALLDADPENAIFNAHYGYLLLLRQEPAAGIPYLKKSLDLGFRTADNYSNLGLCYLFSGDAPRARQPFLNALMVDGKHLASHYWLAKAQAALGQRQSALAHLDEFLALWHGDSDPMVTEARALQKQLKQR